MACQRRWLLFYKPQRGQDGIIKWHLGTRQRDLINRIQTWISSQSKVVNNQLEERRIQGLSEGILSNSKELYKAYEDGYFIYKLQADVEGLNQNSK
jgi:hypothetical protein